MAARALQLNAERYRRDDLRGHPPCCFDKPGAYTIVDGENGYSTLTVIVSVNAPPPDRVYRVFLPVLRR